MRLIYVPFGFRRADLEAELQRRRGAHGEAMTGARARLQALRQTNAELRQYADVLRAEIRSLEQEEDRLRELLARGAGSGADDETGAAPPQEEDQQAVKLLRLRHRIAYYETLYRRLTAGVMALIGPHLRRPQRNKAQKALRKEERHV